jgi:5-methylcytosine-specific restriction enzyme A
VAVQRWRLCAEPRCSEVVPKPTRFCKAHAKGWERFRLSEHGRARAGAYGAKWRRLRDTVLREQPLCSCGEPAVQVHHLDHARPGDATFYERSNLEGVCERCHRARSHERQRVAGR